MPCSKNGLGNTQQTVWAGITYPRHKVHEVQQVQPRGRRLPRGAGAGSALAETQVPFHSRDPYPEIVNFGAHRLESEHLVVNRSEGGSHRAETVVNVRAEVRHFALRCKPVQPLAYPSELPLDHAAKRGNALFLFSGSLYHPHILRTGWRLSMPAWFFGS